MYAIIGYNRPPEIEWISEKVVNASEPLEININATDPDGDQLTYTATLQNGTPLPAGALIDPVTGIFNWTPTAGQTGVYTMAFFVADFRTESIRNVTITVINLEDLQPVPLPGFTNPPTDPDRDGLYEDLNANNRKDFNDVVLMFNQMQWIAANEPVSAFDFNGNGRIDFNDIVKLFGEI